MVAFGLEFKLLKDVLLVISYGIGWLFTMDLSSFLEDLDIDISDLKEDVISEIENELDDLTIDELKNVDMDELIVNSIEEAIKGNEELNELPDEKKEEIMDYLYKAITSKDISNIEDGIREIIQEGELYRKDVWKYNGVSPKDFLP